jgi:hypothetical protein
MTKEEAAIVSAYTGFLIGDVNEYKMLSNNLMYGWVEDENSKDPEHPMKNFFDELQKRALPLFQNIKITEK